MLGIRNTTAAKAVGNEGWDGCIYREWLVEIRGVVHILCLKSLKPARCLENSWWLHELKFGEIGSLEIGSN